MDSVMKEVVTSSSGIIKNILTYDYTLSDVVKEYLNNVLSKNEGNPKYEIEMFYKCIRKSGSKCFDFIEKGSGNPNGFENIDDLKKAYRIADSERSETNNMGYGIYSPITISKDNVCLNLFIQNTTNGDFYSISLYNGDTNEPKIYTEQGDLNTLMKEYNIEKIIEKNGTRNIWFIFKPNKKLDLSTPSQCNLIPLIINCYNSIIDIKCSVDPSISESIGKYYFDYLNVESEYPIKIKYNGEYVSGIDILEPIKSESKKSITFDLLATPNELYIKRENETDWSKMLKTYHKGLSNSKIKVNCSEYQNAKLTICDIDFKTREEEKKISQKHLDKKIWIKVGKTYIFCESFPDALGTNSIRAIIHFDSIENNNFDNFIIPNANKSNSTLRGSQEIVEKITALVKFIVRTKFTMKPPSNNKVKETKDEKRLRIWDKEVGDKLYSICKICELEKINAITFKIKEVESKSPVSKGVPYESICCEQCYKS